MSVVEELTHDVSARLQVLPPAPVPKSKPKSAAAGASTAPWEDVTELFGAAAKELKVGQLVHVEAFSLFDSMSALELMDPKMDAGMALSAAAPRQIAERVLRGDVPLAFPSARDVLATVDALLCSEAAWLHGQPLAQTLLTCEYMHRDALRALLAPLAPPLNESAEDNDTVDARLAAALPALGGSATDTLLLVMAAVCVSTLHAANHAREVVVRADIYEEEDFSPGAGLDQSVLDGWGAAPRERLLQFTIERLETLLREQRSAAQAKGGASKKASKKKNSNKKAGTTPPTSSASAAASSESAGTTSPVKLEALHSNARVSAFLCEALLRRLQLRKVLALVYAELGLAEELTDLALARSSFTSAQEILKSIATEALEFDPECFTGKPFGFDNSLSRLLTSGSPPRELKTTSMDDALVIYGALMREMVIACAPAEWTTMEEVRIFLSDFSRQKPNIVARSYVLLFLYCDKKIYGKHGFMEWLSAEMVMNGVPSVLLSTQEGVQFSARAIETVYESLKVFLHNRSRQRARIEYLLEEWAVLQLEAAAVDERFMTEMAIPKASYPRYFTAWTLEQVCVLMIQHVLLGFELELYAPAEFSTVYWYLDYLCGSRLQNLNFTWGFLEKMKEIMKDHPRGGGNKSKSASASTGDDPTKTRFEREISYTEMQRSMMRAYFQVFAGMEREGLISTAPPLYGSPVIRFQHRFASFQSLHFPAALSYEDYTKNSDFSRYDAELIYKSAEECFKVTRAHGEQVLLASPGLSAGATPAKQPPPSPASAIHGTEVDEVIHIAVANVVQLARREQEQHAQTQPPKATRKSRSSSHVPAATATTTTTGRSSSSSSSPGASGQPVEFDFGSHPHFPVIRFACEKR